MALYTRKRARRSLFDTAILRAVSQVATLLGYVVAVRGLTESDFGIYHLLYAVLPVVSGVASLGLEQTLRRYQPEYLRSGNTVAAARLVRFVAGARFAISLASIGLILLAWDFLAPIFGLEPYRLHFAVFGVILVLHFQARVLQLTLAAHMLHRYSVGMLALLAIVKLVTYSTFLWLGGLTLEIVILCDIAAYGLACAGLWLAWRRHCRPAVRERFRFPPEERRRLLRYGLFNNFNEAGVFVLGPQADHFFIAGLMNPVAVGAYAFYTRLATMTRHLLPTNVFENVIHPLFFAIRPENARERIPRYFSALLDTGLLVQVPIFAYGAVYHREIVAVLFGGKFIEHSLLLPLVLAFATVNTISTPVTLVAQYAERAGIILASKIFAVYNAIALLALIPVAGVYGAAIATGSAQLLKNLFIWWYVRHEARWLNAGAVLGSSLAIWGAYAAAGYGLKALLPAPALVHLLLGGLLAAAAVLVYVRSAALSAADRRLFGSVLHGREARLLRLVGILGPEPGSPAQ